MFKPARRWSVQPQIRTQAQTQTELKLKPELKPELKRGKNSEFRIKNSCADFLQPVPLWMASCLLSNIFKFSNPNIFKSVH